MSNTIDDEAGVVANGYIAPSDDVPPGSYTLIKSGLGTLVLSADNGYSGGAILKRARWSFRHSLPQVSALPP